MRVPSVMLFVFIVLYFRSFSDETRWEARIGFHSRASAQYEYYYEKFNISRIIIHPEFSASTIMNDIAIFVLDGDVVENPGVAPACVTQEMYQSGENCVTLGWGNTLQGQLSLVLNSNRRFLQR